jgi:hypothetical protein
MNLLLNTIPKLVRCKLVADERICKTLEDRYVAFTLPIHLRLDAILTAEHVIDILEIISTFGNGLGTASRCVALLQVSFLAQLAHLDIVSERRKILGKASFQLTWSYTSGATVRRAASLSFRFNVFWMTSVGPVTFNENKLEARPLP